jgi:NAD-dependent dihydropyrimidine dehydrogenase PreA subunit
MGKSKKNFLYPAVYALYQGSGKHMPIDPEFMSKSTVGEHNGHKIRGEVKPPEKLGVHGTSVAVDHDVCEGDGICISICPVGVFDWVDSPGHPVSDKKSDPVNEPACVFCRACEVQCPVQAIKITEI